MFRTMIGIFLSRIINKMQINKITCCKNDGIFPLPSFSP